MIPTKYLFPLIIVGVAIAYYFVGEVALGGLLGLFFGAKKKKQDSHDAVVRSKVHEDNIDQRFDKSTEHHKDAVDSHQKAIKAAEDITAPNEIPDGFKPRKSSSR